MPLSAGTRLGHYDVASLLGEGGMGQVPGTEEEARGPFFSADGHSIGCRCRSPNGVHRD